MPISKKYTDFADKISVQVLPYLEWYDRPILFPLITDRGRELCILVDDTDPYGDRDYGDDIFVSIPISDEDFKEVLEGRTDLRNAFKDVENPRAFVWAGHGVNAIRYQDFGGPLPEKYLCEEGAYVDHEHAKSEYKL
ncbi:hypothetical protein [Sulfitobacter sp. R18_1]|uniref:hypothetical protein n=1 Tax=Sulfitobacter sp. R18_1 TaxID=2821104 RepID=UPI001ADC095F|nr:hypothetical protein [Sulfitobacter sp. R18_1]MBO9428766.1 hypothetical protein [Sulfitobacter sp. R18_1]